MTAILCWAAKNSLRGTLAMLLFSIIPGHFKFYSLLCYCTALLPAICLLFAGYSLQSIIVICCLFAGCSSPLKQYSFFFSVVQL
ncbi:MAG: hypothetical protein ACK55I_36995, partial [bacterium]